MAKYKCQICGYIYDEEKEGVKFEDLPDDWKCPMCFAPKNMFKLVEENAKQGAKDEFEEETSTKEETKEETEVKNEPKEETETASEHGKSWTWR